MTQTTADNSDRVWDVAQSARICMLTSWDGERQRSRPMASRVFKDRHAIYFLDKADSGKEGQIERFPVVSLTYTESISNTYLALTGKAAVSNDRARIQELWSDFDRAYFDSANDPGIRLITVTPEEAELWDGSSKLVAMGKMVLAAMTGAKPSMGENIKVAI